MTYISPTECFVPLIVCYKFVYCMYVVFQLKLNVLLKFGTYPFVQHIEGGGGGGWGMVIPKFKSVSPQVVHYGGTSSGRIHFYLYTLYSGDTKFA